METRKMRVYPAGGMLDLRPEAFHPRPGGLTLQETPLGWKPARPIPGPRSRRTRLKQLGAFLVAVGIALAVIFIICRGVGWCQDTLDFPLVNPPWFEITSDVSVSAPDTSTGIGSTMWGVTEAQAQEPPRTWEVTLAWDGNTEPDLAGYRIYTADFPGGQVLDPADALAEIPAGMNQATLPFTAGDHYLVLTAFDQSLNQSGRSNEVKLSLDEIPPDSNKTFKVKVIVNVEVTTP